MRGVRKEKDFMDSTEIIRQTKKKGVFNVANRHFDDGDGRWRHAVGDFHQQAVPNGAQNAALGNAVCA